MVIHATKKLRIRFWAERHYTAFASKVFVQKDKNAFANVKSYYGQGSGSLIEAQGVSAW